MRINYFIKAAPFFSILLIIVLLNISNQKDYTKLRILIWNTPTLTLGKYLSISTGTGFIISYLITTNLSRLNQQRPINSLNYKDDYKDLDNNNFTETNLWPTYDNTLIETNIKDPSPTINASFRIIGRTKDKSTYFKNNNNVQYEEPNCYKDQADEYTVKDESINQAESPTNDWNDQSYTRW